MISMFDAKTVSVISAEDWLTCQFSPQGGMIASRKNTNLDLSMLTQTMCAVDFQKARLYLV
jgi:hypothetical protein